MRSAGLTERFRRRAEADGFTAVGIAAAEAAPARDRVALDTWLNDGMHAGMTYMARTAAARRDPRAVLPACASVVCVALSYWERDEAVTEGRGRVARYARRRDYHRVLGKRLRRLGAWLDEAAGTTTRAFVDSGPVLERAWAERAGLGWIGKNANLISRTHGSWLLLGELLTTAELVADGGPHEEFCGTCRACLDACPTDAFVEPGRVDSTRCISYWTIEHRGSIPVERRPGIDDWIFGCDVCQDVCPWNERFASPDTADLLEHRTDLVSLDPVDVLRLDEATFRERYSGTPLMRAKWEGMRRNACIVLGNRPRESARPALLRALSDADPVVRAHAGWALARMGGSDVAAELDAAVAREADAETRLDLEASRATVSSA